jgi:hypothetical protein
MKNEMRFQMVEKIDANRFRTFARQSQLFAQRKIATYQHIAQLKLPQEAPTAAPATASATPADEK